MKYNIYIYFTTSRQVGNWKLAMATWMARAMNAGAPSAFSVCVYHEWCWKCVRNLYTRSWDRAVMFICSHGVIITE